ncbi:MAG TPA: Tat pathway signal protein [Solibacterales bacterium]|nr:Tat pathway signal protein [Bryobacterales bacterium]
MPSTRRDFLKTGAAGALLRSPQGARSADLPWYLRAYRWGQTNITEKDPLRYDIAWWREHWKQTHAQAVIINAGGIVAYYPSRFPLHYQAQYLQGRDLFGELTKAAHEDGLFVMARMDSNRTSEAFYQAHPDWFTRDAQGQPYRAADKYITCINSPYYEEYLPAVLREIVERSHPEGVTDNSWAGMGRESICYCTHCEARFSKKSGLALPRQADWDAPAYRQWILWNYERRLELWDLNNRTTQSAGGKDCIWSGMNSGSVTAQARSFRDLREICRRARIVMLDHQRRDDDTGFQQNGDTGKRVHQLLGWDKLAPESMALYQSRPGYFRVAAQPAAEARQWMIAGIAGGIQPWWHYVGAYHEDRRIYATPRPVMQWVAANQEYLINRTPVAAVGLVWSQRNTDFYGRSEAAERVDAPYTGFLHALVRARIPYLPVHAGDIEQAAEKMKLLILPNLGALSDEQCAAVRRFADRGGSVFATGDTSLYTEWGDPRKDFALADLFGAHRAAEPLAARPRTAPDRHTYLRLAPSMRAAAPGPKAGDEPPAQGPRHPVLRGFDQTDLIPFGGLLTPLTVEPGPLVPLTFVPEFPTYPPETAWMREPDSTIPGLILRERGPSRIAYLPAEIDRRYARHHLPDHGDLLANVVRWAAGELPLQVTGPGLIDCHLYRQGSRTILHLVNLTSTAAWRAPMEETIAVGPLRIGVTVVPGAATRARLLVAGADRPVQRRQGQAWFTIPSLGAHEVAVL